MAPRLEFRVSVHWLIAFIGVGIGAVIAHYHFESARKTIEFAAALLGGGTAVTPYC